MPKEKLTRAEKYPDIVEKLKAGEYYRDIAKEHFVSYSVVYDIAQEIGVPTPFGKHLEKKHNKIDELIKQGYPNRYIEGTVGVCNNTVVARRKALGMLWKDIPKEKRRYS